VRIYLPCDFSRSRLCLRLRNIHVADTAAHNKVRVRELSCVRGLLML